MKLFWTRLKDLLELSQKHEIISPSLEKARIEAEIVIGRIFFFAGGVGLVAFGHLANFSTDTLDLPLWDRYLGMTICMFIGLLSFVKKIDRKLWIRLYHTATYFYSIFAFFLIFKSGFNPFMFLTCLVAFTAIIFTKSNRGNIILYTAFCLIAAPIVFLLVPIDIPVKERILEISLFTVLVLVNAFVALISSDYVKKVKYRGTELKRQRILSSSILENSKDLIWALDHKFCLLTYNQRFNKTFEEIYGFLPDVGTQLSSVRGESQRHIRWTSLYEEVIQGVQKSFCSFLEIHGEKKWFEFNLMPIIQEEACIGISVFGRDITSEVKHNREKKQMEQTLVEAELRYKMAMDGAMDGLWDWDATNNMLFLSPRYREILGLGDEYENVSGDIIAELIHPEDFEDMNKGIQNNLEGMTDQINLEFRMRHRDGHYVWALLRGKTFRNENHLPIRISGFLSDISSRKKTQNLLKGFLASSPNGILTLDAIKGSQGEAKDFCYSLINSAAEGLLDIPKEELLGRSLSETPFALKPLNLLTAMKQVYVSGEPQETSRPLWHSKHKPPVWLSVMIASLESGVSLTISDITQKREDAQQLELLSLVASKTDNGVIITNEKGLIEWVNDGFTKISGYNFEEVIGKNPGKILQGAGTSEEARANIRAHLQRGEAISQEILNYRKDGEPYWVSLDLTPIFDKEGKLSKYIGLESDISKRKKFEESLKKAKDSAEAAAQAKSDFLATMSHEIRTPMNAVIGMTGLLLDTQLNNEQKEFVETIRISGDNLLNVINDILDFSKIDSGKMELESQAFDLIEVVENVLDLLGSKAHEKGLELAYDPAVNIPRHINSDPTRVSQILVNLISNAIKFTKKGEVIVKVETLPSNKPDHQFLKFTVQDTGIGIPPEKLNRLFKSFSQVDASTTRKYGGTGLGLAICKKLVEMMHGKIWVESEMDKGSRFIFTIETQLSTTIEQLPKPQLEDIKGSRVLLVDDNPTNLRILQKQCENWGLQAISLPYPREAMSILEKEKDIDMVIVDFQMPLMNGSELGEQIRQTYSRKELPLMLLTSMGKSLTDDERIHFNSFLSKPVRRELLLQHISELLSHSDKSLKDHRIKTKKEADAYAPVQNLKILLAEDNIVNQKVAGRILSKLGYGLDIAANGLEAIEALKRQEFDLVFMDMQMPEMDGLTATETIRRMPEFAERQPLIIAMTANAMKGDRERCLEAGMDDYISKPVKKDQIQHMIEKWFTSEGKLKMERSMA